jgi:mitochondrial fission protein ELM1
VPTLGALNSLPEELPVKQPRGLMLVGGPSRAHGWDADLLLAAIKDVLDTRAELAWKVSDSRRTPSDFLDLLRRKGIAAELVSHRETPPGWVAEQLLTAEEAWVTADSVSMLFEAVTAGARTGVLPMPVRRANTGPARAVADLVAEGFAKTYETWAAQGRTLPPTKRLHETGRCADLVMERLFAAPCQ